MEPTEQEAPAQEAEAQEAQEAHAAPASERKRWGRPPGQEHPVEGLHQRRVQDDLGGQNSDVLDLKVGAQRGPRRVRPGVLGPQRSRGVRKLNFYHQVQLRRQHLPAAQDAHHGGAQQHVRVAALVHRAGDARVVHFVETLHGFVAVVLSALQQVVHGHGAAVVVDVVAALAVGEDLDALDEAGGVGRGRGQRVGAVRVPDAEGDLDGLGVDEGRAAGQRDAADPRGCGGEGAQRAGEVLLHVMPRRHVAGVACFQLVVQALRQLILGSGGDYLHACLYTRILTRTAKEKLFFWCLH